MGKLKITLSNLLPFTAAFLFCGNSYAFSLAIPIDCKYGETCFIQKYTDSTLGQEYQDYKCRHLSNNRHSGTDFRLLNFKEMRKGVNVLAAAGGTVRGVRDGVEDISLKKSTPEKIKGIECGNGVVIKHDDETETQYCHMKKGSIRVKEGEEVATGDVLGEVGLSGETEYPHLHFEVRIKGKPVDPFTGNQMESGCEEAPGKPLWSKWAQKKLEYIPSGILGIGFTDHTPSRDEVEEGVPVTKIKSASPALIFWVEVFGAGAGNVIEMKLLSPSGDALAADEKTIETNKAVYFQYIGKKYDKPIPKGSYTGIFALKDNGKTVLSRQSKIQVE